MNTCRTCLKTRADRDISELENGIDEDNKTCLDIMLFCLDIMVAQDSNITTNLCNDCYSKIISFYKFKTQSLKNDAYLKSLDPVVQLVDQKLSGYVDESDIKVENMLDYDEYDPNLVEDYYTGINAEVDFKDEDILGNVELDEEALSVVQNIKYEYIITEEEIKNKAPVHNKRGSRKKEHDLSQKENGARNVDRELIKKENGLRNEKRELSKKENDPRNEEHKLSKKENGPRNEEHELSKKENGPRNEEHKLSKKENGARNEEHELSKKENGPRNEEHALSKKENGPRNEEHELSKKGNGPRKKEHELSKKENGPRTKVRRQKKAKLGYAKQEQQMCAECGMNVNNLKEHSLRHKPKDERPTLQCRACPKVFLTAGGRNKHYRVSHLGKRSKCDICNKEVVDLTVHKLSVHNRQALPFGCVSCEGRFVSQSALDFHVTKHTKVFPFECDICHMKFRCKSRVSRHIRCVHEKEKQFRCHLCPKAFFQKMRLHTHMRSHTNERPYECEECGKAFMDKKTLSNHMMLHSDVRRYSCPICDMTFQRVGYLSNHMISHTKEKKHPCQYCGVRFGRSDHRRRHEFTAHQQYFTKAHNKR